MSFPHPKRNELIQFLKELRNEIVHNFEQIDSPNRFTRTAWDYAHTGGGEMSVIRGSTFEKAAVNWSGVGGPTFPMNDGSGPFFATGVSLITHMSNPLVPTVHMNVRFIETDKGYWFGGGYDLTPMSDPSDEDTNHFHSTAKHALDPFGADVYSTFAQNAKEYFYIPHRKKERGVGGIFFDHYNTGDFEKDVALWKAVGKSFLPAIMPIYKKRISSPFTAQDKEKQLHLRGHYAEFNLIYDRGTKFGFYSGGNPEAILCSMPPVAKW